MDAEQFDGLVRYVTERSSRRSILGMLGALTLLGGLAALVGGEDAEAHGRRKRRKKRHKHGKGRRRQHQPQHRKGCRTEATATTCEGRCGQVVNNCGKTVDCGACACTAHEQCGSDALCIDGDCHACDVVAGRSLADAVSAAPEGATLYVCPSTFAEGLRIRRQLTIIGAGQGADGGSVVDLDYHGGIVVGVEAGSEAQPVVLRNLRFQKGGNGVIVNKGRSLTMIDCTVRENYSGGVPGAGVFIDTGGTLRLTGCTIEKNVVSSNFGGGIYNAGQTTVSNCLIQDNEAGSGAGIRNHGVLTLRQSQVRENVSPYSGSGIDNYFGQVSLEEGTTVCANDPWETQCNGFDGGAACTETCPGA